VSLAFATISNHTWWIWGPTVFFHRPQSSGSLNQCYILADTEVFLLKWFCASLDRLSAGGDEFSSRIKLKHTYSKPNQLPIWNYSNPASNSIKSMLRKPPYLNLDLLCFLRQWVVLRKEMLIHKSAVYVNQWQRDPAQNVLWDNTNTMGATRIAKRFQAKQVQAHRRSPQAH
jgi:hypothetical protein